MPREEPRDLVQNPPGLVQFPDVELEDARSFWGHLAACGVGLVGCGPLRLAVVQRADKVVLG
jgi:hypothetical protein